MRERLRDYLLGLQGAEEEIELRTGFAGWAAVEAFHRGRRIARVFPKNGLVKVDNRVPDSDPSQYGSGVELTGNGEWSVTASSSANVGLLLLITTDAIPHADGGRITPSGLTAGSRSRLTSTVERSGRPRLPQSTRFAVLMRDRFYLPVLRSFSA